MRKATDVAIGRTLVLVDGGLFCFWPETRPNCVICFLGDVRSGSVALCESVEAQVTTVTATVFLQKCDNNGRLSPPAEDISYPYGSFFHHCPGSWYIAGRECEFPFLSQSLSLKNHDHHIALISPFVPLKMKTFFNYCKYIQEIII